MLSLVQFAAGFSALEMDVLLLSRPLLTLQLLLELGGLRVVGVGRIERGLVDGLGGRLRHHHHVHGLIDVPGML